MTVTVKPAPASHWKKIKAAGVGRIGSMLDLLNGKFPADIMARVADPEEGLFPKLGELKFSCSCPDWAQMCKHVAAVLYAFGHRLDREPELLFTLRAVDPTELISLENLARSATAKAETPALAASSLTGIFGIELDLGEAAPPAKPTAAPAEEPPKDPASPPRDWARPRPRWPAGKAGRCRLSSSVHGKNWPAWTCPITNLM